MRLPIWKQQMINALVRKLLEPPIVPPPPKAERTRARSNQEACAALQGHDYTDEEREFMMAMDRYKREAHRPYPDCRDVLRVARQLGYRKQEAAQHAPPDAT